MAAHSHGRGGCAESAGVFEPEKPCCATCGRRAVALALELVLNQSVVDFAKNQPHVVTPTSSPAAR